LINKKYLGVIEALDKQLRDHELPSDIKGYLVVTEYFSYLVDDKNAELSGCQQPAILIQGPEIASQLEDKIPQAMGGLTLYIEPCTVRGILLSSGVGLFERCLYRINTLEIAPPDADNVLLTDLLFD
jgi:hypothetical protein